MTSLMKTNIDGYINCLKKLKDCEKKFEEKMDDFMKKTKLLNYEVSIESLVEGAQQQLIGFKDRVKKMESVLNRKDVVITIFGSVSVGKSCLLNVLLNDEIFWSASAHSTSCFVTVTKGDDNCLIYRDKMISFNNVSDMKNKINELSSNLSGTDDTLQNNEMLQIFIKEPSSPVLSFDGNDVFIVDTPGADRNMNIHNIIKDQTQNSDIFIFMLNCNITDVDKRFFNYQTETSVRPDIFILVNKWDESDRNRKHLTERSKLSITEDCLKFIRKQKGGNEQDIESQIYFISTTEALDIRTNLQNYQNLTLIQKQRYDEFLKFEEKLQEYIDNPVQNKSRRYESDIQDLNSKMEGIIIEFNFSFIQWMENTNPILNLLNNMKRKIETLRLGLKIFICEEIKNLNRKVMELNISDEEKIQDNFLSCRKIADVTLNEINKKCEENILNFAEEELSYSKLKGKLQIVSKIRTETELLLRKTRPTYLVVIDQVLRIGTILFKWILRKNFVSDIFGLFQSWIDYFFHNQREKEIIENEMKNKSVELQNEINSWAKEIYARYENVLNEMYKNIDKSTTYWEDYVCKLNQTVIGLH